MKKFAFSLLAAVLMSFGLVATSGSPANAYECPYTGCFGTQTDVEGPGSVVQGSRPKYHITVVALGSEDSPSGEVLLTFTNPRGRLKANRTVTAPYDGGVLTLRPAKKFNKPGAWSINAKFTSADGPYYPSEDTTITHVARR